jgi:8-hydroxy-5-deazaflavin:NADPH oxidoreductase
MRIGIIGAGMIGSTLARRLTALGHTVAIANSRGPDTLRDLAAETGAQPVPVAEAARNVEMVVIAVPERAVPDLPRDLFSGVADSVIVIDAGNYYPSRDGNIPAIEAGETESGWVAAEIGRPVIKAFNTIYFKNLLEKGAPPGTPGRLAVPVAGDLPDARARVLQLVDDLGFDAVDAGGLQDSWRQQPGSPCYGKELDAARLQEALAAAEQSRMAEYRKAADDAARAYFTPPPAR